MARAALSGIQGLYRKKGKTWFYFQPPTPKGGTRPKAVALKTQDLVTAIERAGETTRPNGRLW